MWRSSYSVAVLQANCWRTSTELWFMGVPLLPLLSLAVPSWMLRFLGCIFTCTSSEFRKAKNLIYPLLCYHEDVSQVLPPVGWMALIRTCHVICCPCSYLTLASGRLEYAVVGRSHAEPAWALVSIQSTALLGDREVVLFKREAIRKVYKNLKRNRSHSYCTPQPTPMQILFAGPYKSDCQPCTAAIPCPVVPLHVELMAG